MSAIDHPPHYNANRAGIECIDLAEQLPFCEGNAVKYLWRADHKGRRHEDLLKARWYVERVEARAKPGPPRPSLPKYEVDRVLEALLAKAVASFGDALIASAIVHVVSGFYPGAGLCIDQLLAQPQIEAGKP